MNFNIDNNTGEYELFKSQTQEIINLYGIYCKYLITEKINKDLIFGEHSHIKIDNEQIFEMYMLPSETEGFDGGDLFGKFGLQNFDSLDFFIGVEDMENIHPNIVNREGKGWDFIIGNLIILPNNKIMEITNFEPEVKGNNNLFTYDNRKNVYQITVKSYIANRDDYTESDDISTSDEFEYEDFGNLESIFSDDIEKSENITSRSQDNILEDEVIYPAEVREKPIRNKNKEANPFGDLG